MDMRILKEKYACSTMAQIPMTISKVITGWENLCNSDFNFISSLFLSFLKSFFNNIQPIYFIYKACVLLFFSSPFKLQSSL